LFLSIKNRAENKITTSNFKHTIAYKCFSENALHKIRNIADVKIFIFSDAVISYREKVSDGSEWEWVIF